MSSWGGLGKLQRNWILLRDGNRCQHHRFIKGRWVRCNIRKDLHVHHIFPQRGNKSWSPHRDPHRPQNLITLCGNNHHNGTNGVHPDMARALEQYREGDKEAFDNKMKARQVLVENGEVYWNTTWDWLYSFIAKRATNSFSQRHGKYPEKRRRKEWKQPKRR